jgi:hypothetical protein
MPPDRARWLVNPGAALPVVTRAVWWTLVAQGVEGKALHWPARQRAVWGPGGPGWRGSLHRPGWPRGVGAWRPQGGEGLHRPGWPARRGRDGPRVKREPAPAGVAARCGGLGPRVERACTGQGGPPTVGPRPHGGEGACTGRGGPRGVGPGGPGWRGSLHRPGWSALCGAGVGQLPRLGATRGPVLQSYHRTIQYV